MSDNSLFLKQAHKEMSNFAKLFGISEPASTYVTSIKVLLGNVSYNSVHLPMLDISAVVYFMPDGHQVPFGELTVLVQIGEFHLYRSLPFMEQYDIRMTYNEAVEFVHNVKNTVKHTPLLFTKFVNESDTKYDAYCISYSDSDADADD
jgi:hypothetical protein